MKFNIRSTLDSMNGTLNRLHSHYHKSRKILHSCCLSTINFPFNEFHKISLQDSLFSKFQTCKLFYETRYFVKKWSKSSQKYSGFQFIKFPLLLQCFYAIKNKAGRVIITILRIFQMFSVFRANIFMNTAKRIFKNALPNEFLFQCLNPLYQSTGELDRKGRKKLVAPQSHAKTSWAEYVHQNHPNQITFNFPYSRELDTGNFVGCYFSLLRWQ